MAVAETVAAALGSLVVAVACDSGFAVVTWTCYEGCGFDCGSFVVAVAVTIAAMTLVSINMDEMIDRCNHIFIKAIEGLSI